MGYPRSVVVDSTQSGWYHCLSRCTRRLFLCGDQYEHRKQWIEDRITLLADVFAIEIAGFSVMSNHVHIVAHTNPDQPGSWTAIEAAERWAQLYPNRIRRITREAKTDAEAAALKAQFLQNRAQNSTWVSTWRLRLASLSWFHKLLKEPIARRANAEDGVTGHFWEGRFRCIPLLTEGAILACMVYVDLNLIRARIVEALKDVVHTSIVQRLDAMRPRAPARQRSSGASRTGRNRATTRRRIQVPLLPIESIFRMTTRQYVSIVATTAGVPIDRQDHDDILTSLGIDTALWGGAMAHSIRWFGTAIGRTTDLLGEATRRNVRRVVNPLRVFVE